MEKVVKLFSTYNTPRCHYVFELVFNQLLGLEYELVTNIDLAHINYSNSYVTNAINFPVNSDLLNSSGFKPIEIPYKNFEDEAVFFPNNESNPSDWDFDVFSSIFYLVSRYEEYQGFTADAHHRFPPECSILHKTQSFEFPLVNIWVQKLKQKLLLKWPDLKIIEPGFRFISTIDVDSTFQYQEKGFFWGLAGFFKDLVKGNFYKVLDRLKVQLRFKKDPFDIFDTIELIHKKLEIEVIYFWLLGNYSKFDKNINWLNSAQSKILYSLARSHAIGAHPSYLSNSKEDLLDHEIVRLGHLTKQRVNHSRQHFLIHQFPLTFQKLIKTGIQNDYTMGYTSQYGFRAGIASPFYFYDLEKEEKTALLLHPFCSMDITPLHYYKFSVEQAIEKNKTLLNRVKAVNGLFISLWHNESLSGTMRWKNGWEKVYHQLLVDVKP